MSIRVLTVAVICIGLAGLFACRHGKRLAMIEWRGFIKKALTCVLSLCGFLGLATCCLLARFDVISASSKEILPANFVSDIRAFMKWTFGTESVFSVLQAVCLCSFVLFSSLSVSLCVVGIICVAFGTVLRKFSVGANFETVCNKENVPVRSRRLFLLLLKYNS